MRAIVATYHFWVLLVIRCGQSDWYKYLVYGTLLLLWRWLVNC